MKIKYLGISNLCFDDGKNTILFDACLTRPNLKRLIFNKIGTNQHLVDRILAAAEIKKVDDIFISHSHYDHALDAGYLAHKFKAHLYGSSSTLNIAKGAGIDDKQLSLFKAGQTYQIGNFKITVLRSVHSKPHFFNNDLGQEIKKPLGQPAFAWQFKEGGSYDFLVENHGQKFLVRPSFGYVPNELKNVHADYLFLGDTSLSTASQNEQINFFSETIERVKPKMVVPLHWDNFLRSLTESTRYLPFAKQSNGTLKEFCAARKIKFVQMPPLSGLQI